MALSMRHMSIHAIAAFVALLLFGLALSPAVIAHAPQGERRCGWYLMRDGGTFDVARAFG
jgi:hypothetical protein